MSITRIIRKIIKRILITAFTLLVLFVTLAYIFQDKIIAYFIDEVNKDLNTTIKYDKVELSLFKNFPQTSILVKNVTLIETPKGSQDTLAHFEKLYLSFNLYDIIKGNYRIKKCDLYDGMVRMKIDSNGVRNYDITKPDTLKEKSNVSLDLQRIKLNNIDYSFQDQQNSQYYHLFATNLNANLEHHDQSTQIALNGSAFSYNIGLNGNDYFKNKNLDVESNLTIDSSKLSVNESSIGIENSKFNVDGIIGLQDNDTISFQLVSNEGNLKTLLSLLPGSTNDQIEKYKSKGSVYFKGSIEGKRSKPHINVDFGFQNLSLQHPQLKKQISEAQMTGNFNNGSLNSNKTSILSINKTTGKIDNEQFQSELKLTDFDNPNIDFSFKGTFSLGAILGLAPNPKITKPTGRLICDIVAKGPLKKFQKDLGNKSIVASGSVKAENIGFFFNPTNSDFKEISGEFNLKNHDVSIPNLVGKVGNSDFQMNGKFLHFIDFLLDYDQPLNLDANLKSNLVDLDELLSVRDTTAAPTSQYRFVLSPKINVKFQANINKIKFDRATNGFEYKNLKGAFTIKNQIINFNNINVDVAGGSLTLKNGEINARQKDNIKVTSKAILKTVKADSIFYLSNNFHQNFLTSDNLRGDVSGNISAKLAYNSKLELLHDQINIDNHLFIANGQLINFKPLMDLYSLMNEKTDNKVAKFLGLQAYKFFKTDNPNINSFQKLSFKPLFLNEINVRNSTIDVTQIALQSNAGDVNIYGNHNYSNDSINYYVDVQLKNYHKINKNRQKAEQFGEVEEDKTSGVWLYYKIFGTLSNYKYPLDWNRMLKQKKRKFWENIKPGNEDSNNVVVPEFEEGDWMED